MRFLKVSGDNDFSAMTFMDQFSGDWSEVWEQTYRSEGHNMRYVIEELDEDFELEAYMLDCDEETYSVLQETWADYDMQKATDIIPVDEW